MTNYSPFFTTGEVSASRADIAKYSAGVSFEADDDDSGIKNDRISIEEHHLESERVSRRRMRIVSTSVYSAQGGSGLEGEMRPHSAPVTRPRPIARVVNLCIVIAAHTMLFSLTVPILL